MTRSLKEIGHTTKVTWPSVGGYGHVPIESVMPNPLNPRTWISEDETKLLADSIRRGGQREIATVRPATEAEQIQHPGVRYVLTSGGRRYQACLEAGKETIEVRVRAYTERRDEMLDLFMLNESRKQVSDLERALYIAALAKAFGWTTQAEIAAGIGETQSNVSRLMTVARCTAKVQARMHPSIPESDRLSLTVTAVLCNADAATQDDLIERMPRHLKTAVAQVAWIKAEMAHAGVVLPTRDRKPSNLRKSIQALADTVMHKARLLRRQEGLEHLFDNSGDGDAAILASQLREAHTALGLLIGRVEEIAAGEKRDTMLVPRDKLPERQIAQRAAVVDTLPIQAPTRVVYHEPPPEKKPRVVVRPASIPREEGTVVRATADARLKALAQGASMRVERMDPKTRRLGYAHVGAAEYLQLWDKGLLYFQVNDKQRPPNYPDGDALRALLEEAKA